MEMEEFTDAVEKVRSIAADIRSLEAESMDLMRSRKMGDHTVEREEAEKGQRDVEEKSQIASKPRRLLRREVNCHNSNTVSPCPLTNYQSYPVMEGEQAQSAFQSENYTEES